MHTQSLKELTENLQAMTGLGNNGSENLTDEESDILSKIKHKKLNFSDYAV